MQILMDESLLAEIDEAAKRSRTDRSKLIRTAVKRFLASTQVQTWEEEDIAAYRRRPLTRSELEPWDKARLWPEE